MTVLGCLLVTALITLMIMIVNYQSKPPMSIIIIPWILDISWLGQLLIFCIFPLSFYELGSHRTGKI